MANHTLPMTEALHAYLLEVAIDETPVQRRLREETTVRDDGVMQIAPEQGAFMGWLAGLVGARRAVEVGTFTGYSALAVARAMPADGRLVCCEVSEEYGAIARRYWEEAGVADRVELRLGPAVDTLRDLLAEGGAGTYDLAFVDADKPSYDAYYEACLELLRPGGVLLIDNVLWSGAVADPEDTRESTRALRALNEKVFDDPRVDACLVPIADGLTLARKRVGR
jgi:predicted O-methyltransferase YrrM